MSRDYLTGDRGRYLENGEIEFLGRIDGQVKIGGVRVELGDVKTRLLEHPHIEDAAVVTRVVFGDGDVQLVAKTHPTDALRELEDRLCAIIADMFERDKIDPSDDFFALGGHALLAMRLVNRFRSAPGVDLPITFLLDSADIRELADRIRPAHSGSNVS